MIAKIKVDKTINNDNTNIVHLILTLDDNLRGFHKFQLQANCMAIRLNGSNHIEDVEFLVEKLAESTLRNRICMFAKEVISAQELIDNEKLLIGKRAPKKAPAKKAPAKKAAELKVV
tara:strand:+ start:338 stop:688 length:351 start_codon:yes stop_codon:yes gene_type:complete